MERLANKLTKVKLVQHKDTQEKFALKFINKKDCIESKSLVNIFRERILLQNLMHPLIVNLKFAFQDDMNLFFVIDYCQGGDLRFHLDAQGTIDDVTLRIYAAELASVLSYLHSFKVVHRYSVYNEVI